MEVHQIFKKIKLNKHMKVKVIILVHQAKALAPTCEEALAWSGAENTEKV